MYIIFAPVMQIKQNKLWLWKPEETSPVLPVAPKIGHIIMSAKQNLEKKTKNL